MIHTVFVRARDPPLSVLWAMALGMEGYATVNPKFKKSQKDAGCESLGAEIGPIDMLTQPIQGPKPAFLTRSYHTRSGRSTL
jgi:hypothetical protein